MKVLILHASAGAGHKRAAEALAKGFALEDSRIEVSVRDILEFTGKLFQKTYASGYLDIVRSVPELWGYMYSQSDKKALLPARKKIRALFNDINSIEFQIYLKKYKPDIIICTHFMPLEILSRRSRSISAPLYCVVTDFAVHSLWVLPNVARYYVATDEAFRQLMRKGMPESGVRVTGIPVDPVFSESEQTGSVRRRLGLDPDLPVVLLLSGGYGVGPTVELVRSFKGADPFCQLIVVAGKNEKMKAEVVEAAKGFSVPVSVLGFVSNIHELMDAAEVIISKPGGLTTSEILAKGKAMIIIDPIPGQEQRNCEYLLEAGVALRLYEPADAPYKVKSLLTDPVRLARIKESAGQLGRPLAAREIARDIIASAGSFVKHARRRSR